MKLVLEVTTKAQKEDIIQFAKKLNIAVEVLENVEDEDDAAMVRAIQAGAQGDFLSPEESEEFLAHLAK